MAHSYPTRPATHPHPIHGILSAYPLAFFTGALATDIIYIRSANMMWANFSVWLITAGLVMGALAAVAGIVDAALHRGRRTDRPLAIARLHNLLVIFMLAFALVNAFVHSRDAWTSVVPAGVTLSVITSVLAIAASWLGYVLQSREIR